jgi:hypothetical protein
VSSCSPVNRLIPFWAKDLRIGNKLDNARAEPVHEKPSFRTAFRSKRALIAVDAFYEWLETDQISEKTGQPLKQPFALLVNCTKLAQPGRSLSEGTWCGVGLGTVAGGGAGRSAADR